MVMGLGLARNGEEEDGKVSRRLGLVRWVRKELFVGKRVLLSRSSDSTVEGCDCISPPRVSA